MRGKYMYNFTKKMFISLFVIVLFIALTIGTLAKTKVNPGDKDKTDEIQRKYERPFDLQENTISNIQFFTTNYGIFGLDVLHNKGGGIWPRGSFNQYIYGGGIWFGAQKFLPNDPVPHKLVEITYNPNNGKSWMVPGRIEDGDLFDETDIYKYRTCFSTDFLTNDGKPITAKERDNWPIWDASENPEDTLKKDRYYGYYIPDQNDRTLTRYPNGPAFISGEDIFATYKDTDLDRFDGGLGLRQPLGYPFKLQFEQMIYSWGFGDYKDFIFIKYDIVNKSSDTLFNSWMAPTMDIDIGRNPSPAADNDRVKYYSSDPSLNLALQWTDIGIPRGEKGYGFGYLGFVFLESPAVDANSFIRKDKKVYNTSEQLGLKTFKNWNIDEDINEDEDRYNTMASERRDGDDNAGDKRFMMATGPFHVLPNDTVRVVVGMVLAGPATKTDADGSDEDAAELVRKVKFAQSVYDNNFRAPSPPDRTQIKKWIPLNNAVRIEWDNTAEMSHDIYETGMDFMGLRLYRARSSNLDTFDVDQITPNNKYSRGKGPFGYKQLAQWEIPSPFWKSYNRAGTNKNDLEMPLIDSMRIAGPVVIGNTIDSMAIKVMRIGKGFILAGPDTWVTDVLFRNTGRYDFPVIMGIDTAILTAPWGKFYDKHFNRNEVPVFHDPFNPNTFKHYLLDTVSIGTVHLNPALLTYNPLLRKKETVTVADTSSVRDFDNDTIYFRNTFRKINVNGVDYMAVDRLIPYEIHQAMKDTLHLRAVLDSVYSYIQKGFAQVKFFPEFEQSLEVRTDVISTYIDLITNHRTFVDIGDDNRDGVVSYESNPVKTEKLINNVDYFYKILAYDEGDYNQPTPLKHNTGDLNLPNVAETSPKAEAAMKSIDFKVTYVDSAKIGGLYNFKMFGIDADRAQQLYAGHELELALEPAWSFYSFPILNTTTTKDVGIYMRHLVLTDLSDGKILFNGNTYFEQTPCSFLFRNLFTEDAYSLVSADTTIHDTISGKEISIGVPYNNDKIVRSGKFTTGYFTQDNYCYSSGFANEAYGTIGLTFDFTLEQRGGRYRPDSSSGIVSSSATTPISFMTDQPNQMRDLEKVLATTVTNFLVTNQRFVGYPSGNFAFQGYGMAQIGSFNNGPAEYLVEFLPGGIETMQLSWYAGTKTFEVPYLNVKVTNIISYKRPGLNGEVDVTYPGELQHINLGIDTISVPPKLTTDPRSLLNNHDDYINKYNLSAYGYINARYVKFLSLKRSVAIRNTEPYSGRATFIGQQGRYYITGFTPDKSDTVDFVNTISASGVTFALDYARWTGRLGTINEWADDPIKKKTFGLDFAAGDKIILKTTGGALGFPLPGAKVRFRIDSAVPHIESYTDDILDQVDVVPNPYYITHQGQKSAYDAKIYFTRLPKICNIDIYTVTGDLIQTIKHDEYISTDPDKEGVDVWNLLSTNKQRVQSQILVALITTPNGAQTIKKFAVVVGGFRLID